MSRNNIGSSSGSGGQSNSFVRNIREFIGETVTIFTTSGGASGSGFTGVILSVNSRFVRLVTEQGTAPTNPLADAQGDMGIGGRNFGGVRGNSLGRGMDSSRAVGSVCDIPIDRIVAFTHNAI